MATGEATPTTPFDIRTPRLYLRHFVLADAPFILRLLNEPSFIRHIADKGVRTLADARNYLQTGPMASYATNGFGLNLVALRETGAPIGMCGILQRETLPGPDLGYALLPEYCARGYGLEAATTIINHARDVLHLQRLLAITDADNTASMKLLVKLGFRFAHPAPMAEAGKEVMLYELEFLRTTPAFH